MIVVMDGSRHSGERSTTIMFCFVLAANYENHSTKQMLFLLLSCYITMKIVPQKRETFFQTRFGDFKLNMISKMLKHNLITLSV